MLQRKTISPVLEKTLQTVMKMEAAKDFRLAGGTALALQIGHRRSIDLDFFSDKYKKKYDFEFLFKEVKNQTKSFLKIQLKDLNEIGIILHCSSPGKKEMFKMDFWKWPNPFLHPPLIEKNIRFATLDDLVAMKLEAINDRSNYRDFVDIAFLSEKYSFAEMAKFYTKRTLSTDYTRIITALSNPDNLVRDQKLYLLNNVTEKQLKEKVNYMLYVYTIEQEQKKQNL